MAEPKGLTAAEVAEIRARAEKATKGPWDVLVGKTLIHIETSIDNPSGAGVPICSIPKKKEGLADFIAHSRTDVPALCDTVELLRAENTRLKEDRDDLRESLGVAHLHTASTHEYAAILAGRIATLEADRDRLKGLIEGMGHEAGCASHKPNLTESEENEWDALREFELEPAQDGLTDYGKERWAVLNDKAMMADNRLPCNCIQSKVNA